uniref:Zinc carboxypeptidase A 1 n=1 Tax=Strigamia maritima TaxID=126957 RepID=T1J515_STRMM
MLKFPIIFLYFLTSADAIGTIDEEKTVSYKGHQVYGIIPRTTAHLQYLMALENDNENFKFWSEPHEISKTVVMQVSPEKLMSFRTQLTEKQIPFGVKINDLQKKIDIERNENYPQMLFRVMGSEAFDLGQYHTLDEIYTYLALLNEQYPSISNLSTIGTSNDGREIKLLRISNNTQKENKPSIVIDAGIHAREWISPATAIYIIKELLTSNDSSTVQLRNTFDWYVIPVLNPDGYAYTWTMDRLWRKNRRKDKSTICVGVDLNRNFDIGFSTGPQRNPCSDTFAGPTAFSEPETSTLQTLVKTLSNLKMAFSLHSYSQTWVTSYVYKFGYPANYEDLALILEKALDKAKLVNQTTYEFGPGALLMYPATGTSVDWYTDTVGVKYAFIVELRDNGDHGFLLPKSQILPTGEETWTAINEIAMHVGSLKPH